jgi:hypothetical protein
VNGRCLLDMKMKAELLFYLVQNVPLRSMKCVLSRYGCEMVWMHCLYVRGHAFRGTKLTGGGTK